MMQDKSTIHYIVRLQVVECDKDSGKELAVILDEPIESFSDIADGINFAQRIFKKILEYVIL